MVSHSRAWKKFGLDRLTTTITAVAAAITTTTATAAASTTAVTTTTATAGTRGTILTRTGFVHGECPAIDFVAVQRFDGRLGGLLCFHGHKGEPARASAEFVHDEIHFSDGAVGGKKVLELVF